MRETTRKAALGLLAVAAAGGLTAGIADAAKNNNSNASKKAAKAKAKAWAKARRHARHTFGPGRGFKGPEELTGDDLAKAKAAGEAAVPGATLDHAFKAPDAGPSGNVAFIVIMRESDGTHTLLLLDKDFAVVKTLKAGPHGGPGGPGHPFDRPQELTGDDLAKAKAAGEGAVPGATLDHAFKAPDAGPNGNVAYAVIMEASDGTHTLVLLDKDFNVVAKRSAPGGPGGPMGGPGGPPNEPELTGDDADKAKQDALDAVPGGTVWRASKEDPAESTGATYEVHVRKSDGSEVEVLLDENFKVIKTQAFDHPGPPPGGGPGWGRHGHDGPHGWGGPPPGAPGQQNGGYDPGAAPQQYT